MFCLKIQCLRYKEKMVNFFYTVSLFKTVMPSYQATWRYFQVDSNLQVISLCFKNRGQRDGKRQSRLCACHEGVYGSGFTAPVRRTPRIFQWRKGTGLTLMLYVIYI